MELRDFIAKTISEIQNGVQLAIDQTTDVKGAVNPVWGVGNVGKENIQNVHFDIAVTAAEKNDEKVGSGIKVLGIGIDGEVASFSENRIPTGQVIIGCNEENKN